VLPNTDTYESPAKVAQKPMLAVIALSAGIASFLIWLIYFKGKIAAPHWVGVLPAANATFNSLSAFCLILGYINIRRGKRATHMRFMLMAAVFSSLFLASYITYHFFHGDTLFAGHGWIRPAYFFVLISHIGLSIVALPFIILTLGYALRSRFSLHRRIARWTFPIWLYVSITGVVVYVLLRSFSA
jgi:putative membrane protein